MEQLKVAKLEKELEQLHMDMETSEENMKTGNDPNCIMKHLQLVAAMSRKSDEYIADLKESKMLQSKEGIN